MLLSRSSSFQRYTNVVRLSATRNSTPVAECNQHDICLLVSLQVYTGHTTFQMSTRSSVFLCCSVCKHAGSRTILLVYVSVVPRDLPRCSGSRPIFVRKRSKNPQRNGNGVDFRTRYKPVPMPLCLC